MYNKLFTPGGYIERCWFFPCFLSLYFSITYHLTLAIDMEYTLPELLYLGKENYKNL